MSLGSIRSATLIFISVPLALIGGIIGLYVTGEYLSVPTSVGFIALFGIAVQNGLVLVTYINQLRDELLPIYDAILKASELRLRPVLMTALTTVLGLVPLILSTGMGSEVQRPLAVVVVFSLISSTFLTLILILLRVVCGEETAETCARAAGPDRVTRFRRRAQQIWRQA